MWIDGEEIRYRQMEKDLCTVLAKINLEMLENPTQNNLVPIQLID